MRSQLKRALNLTEAGRDRALARVREELDGAASRLEGRDYLCGDRFTAADLTFAALLAPRPTLQANSRFECMPKSGVASYRSETAFEVAVWFQAHARPFLRNSRAR